MADCTCTQKKVSSLDTETGGIQNTDLFLISKKGTGGAAGYISKNIAPQAIADYILSKIEERTKDLVETDKKEFGAFALSGHTHSEFDDFRVYIDENGGYDFRTADRNIQTALNDLCAFVYNRVVAVSVDNLQLSSSRLQSDVSYLSSRISQNTSDIIVHDTRINYLSSVTIANLISRFENHCVSSDNYIYDLSNAARQICSDLSLSVSSDNRRISRLSNEVSVEKPKVQTLSANIRALSAAVGELRTCKSDTSHTHYLSDLITDSADEGNGAENNTGSNGGYTGIAAIIDQIYPVGSLYFGMMSKCPLRELLPGSSWVSMGQDYVLQGASDKYPVGSQIKAGLPAISLQISKIDMSKFNHTHTVNDRGHSHDFSMSFSGSGHDDGGAYFTFGKGASSTHTESGTSTSGKTDISINQASFSGALDLSPNIKLRYDTDIYGKSSTVQPAAITVNIWKRVK